MKADERDAPTGVADRPFREVMLSGDFIERWKALLVGVYGYGFDGPFARVPQIAGRSVLSYLPLLNYSDLLPGRVPELVARAGGRPYQIRLLDPAYEAFEPGDTVTMRIDLRKPTFDEVHAGIAKRTRRYLRDLESADFTLRTGRDAGLAHDFSEVFRDVMHRLGTPPFSEKLFQRLPELLDARYYVMYRAGAAVAAAVVLHDEHLAWVPWSGTRHAFLDERPGLPMYWAAIRDAYEAGRTAFDYGRSPYGAGTYEFKLRWGAAPVKVTTVTSQAQDVYTKYELAARVWKRLPRGVTDRVGPVLCRYLADL
jgi:hypothetical protein